MTAHELIESYVADVAGRLPRKLRGDVAFELRALLREELQGRSDAAGRDADAAMATDLLRAFGPPAEVASRYRPTLIIVDPADGRRFLSATLIGLAIIWSAGLWVCLQPPIASGWDLLTALGRWWGSTVIPSLWWPGVLVVGFGLSAWTRRRSPRTADWKPREAVRASRGIGAMELGVVGILCGLFVLLEPRWLLDIAFGGRAAPAAYQALTYTETFRHRQAPWLIGLLLLNVPLWAAVIVNGHWSALLRRVDVGLRLATCAALAWTLFGGPVFIASVSDRSARFAMALTIAFTLIDLGYRLHRAVRPAPDREGDWSERTS